jgi:photosystem II stability/assembly factor-like uncharacterized protein
MNTMPQSFCGLSRLLRKIALLIAVLAIQGVANAGQPASAQDRIAALEFEHASRVLLKATAKTLYRSSDEGKTWTKIVLPPTAADHAIAAVTVSARDKDAIYVAGPGLGVLRSTDGGRSWVAGNEGLPSREVIALTTHADQPDTLYAYLAGKGIFRSQDAGLQWRLMDRGPREEIRHFVHSNMPGSMETGWLFAATSKGVRRSMDCFCGWHDAGGLAGEVYAVSYNPDEPQRVYAAAQEGLFVSTDGGEQWTNMKSPSSVITTLVAEPSGVLYAGGDGHLFRSSDRGMTWERVDA